MKKIVCLILGNLLFSTSIYSHSIDSTVVALEETDTYKFETLREHPITPVRSQDIDGAHWYYSGLSFIESEILKTTADEYNLSELFLISNKYYDKAAQYVRSEGRAKITLSKSWEDVLELLKTYGIVPESEMANLKGNDKEKIFKEMNIALEGYAAALVENSITNPSDAWKLGCQGVIDAYLGKKPSSFNVEDEEYTPQNFLESLYINLNDYVVITSWLSHSDYKIINLNETDSREGDHAYNVPLDKMVEIMDNALENGYTIAWTCDATEDGFTKEGVAVVPDMAKMKNGDEYIQRPCDEVKVTSEMRHKAYKDYSTTADYTMHIYGIAKDQNGTEYYMAKNPMGNTGKYGGVWYVSKEYVKYKTICFMLNKKGIPANISKKLNIALDK